MLTKRKRREIISVMKQAATLQMRLSPEIKATLDELRKSEPDLPTRSEMIRRLIERAAATKRSKK